MLLIDKGSSDHNYPARQQFTSVSAGLVECAIRPPDVITLRGIWGERGRGIVEQFRRANPTAAILVLAAAWKEEDEAAYLAEGADVYAEEDGADVERMATIGKRLACRRRHEALTARTLH